MAGSPAVTGQPTAQAPPLLPIDIKTAASRPHDVGAVHDVVWKLFVQCHCCDDAPCSLPAHFACTFTVLL